MNKLVRLTSVLWLLAAATLAAGQLGTGRYAVILTDSPAAQQLAAAKPSVRATAALGIRRQIESRQTTLKQEISKLNVKVAGATQTVLNAVFVTATPAQAAQLRALSGVKSVTPLRRFRMRLDTAVELENVPAAWNRLGGVGSAGAGVKIAIIDSGIDQAHPGFQDASLTAPAGYPKCSGTDCAFTSNKVIVARSYVSRVASGSQPNPAADSRPDDTSPRDHIGHGTALGMIAAGVTNTGPVDTITGVAPKAFLGNYRVFGSPGVNDSTTGDAIIQALEDALNDGMDIAVLSLGGPALYGPLDTGSACGGANATDLCDAEATAVENAVAAGMSVAAAAGNSGDSSQVVPSFGTIESPAIAPSAIAVAASTNSHSFAPTVQVRNQGAPSNLEYVTAVFGDGPEPASAVTAPLADVAALDGTGDACSALPAGSLNGAFALIFRTPTLCTFLTKVGNAQNAGAAGVILIQSEGQSGLIVPGGLLYTEIPSVMISNSNGQALKDFLAAHAGAQATIDPALRPVAVSTFNTVADFSSHGPSIDLTLKPEVTAVGAAIYMAAQKFDPNGVMYDPTGYTIQSGTSLSAPMVAGALALVKQRFPDYTALQRRSAIVNTAAQIVTEGGGVASAISAGNGMLSAGDALQATVTATPSTVSFTSASLSQTLTVHNGGSETANLTLGAAALSGAPPALSAASLAVPAGQDQQVTVTLAAVTAPGIYEGGVTIQGAGASLRVPYIYVVGDGVPFDLVPLFGDGFDGTVGQPIPIGGLAFKILDQYGVGVSGLPVTFQSAGGGGQITSASSQTDKYGIATAAVTLGANAGTQSFIGGAGGLWTGFTGWARVLPTISTGGIVNAANFELGPGVSPGSYIALFGAGLSDSTGGTMVAALPLSIDYVSVSFDVPSANLSLPGRLIFVSPGQVNVQVPWELAGQTSVMVKVTVMDSPGVVTTVPVASVSPAVYRVPDPGTGQPTAAALDLASTLISSEHPAVQGEYIQLYLNGLGAVTNPPAIGFVAQSSPLSTTVETPAVTIGGVASPTIQFSGLTPTTSGLYQINLVVPPGAPTGVQPLVVTIGGVSSTAVNIPVS
jgi:minor extracellular serine protease Vpr